LNFKLHIAKITKQVTPDHLGFFG